MWHSYQSTSCLCPMIRPPQVLLVLSLSICGSKVPENLIAMRGTNSSSSHWAAMIWTFLSRETTLLYNNYFRLVSFPQMISQMLHTLFLLVTVFWKQSTYKKIMQQFRTVTVIVMHLKIQRSLLYKWLRTCVQYIYASYCCNICTFETISIIFFSCM